MILIRLIIRLKFVFNAYINFDSLHWLLKVSYHYQSPIWLWLDTYKTKGTIAWTLIPHRHTNFERLTTKVHLVLGLLTSSISKIWINRTCSDVYLIPVLYTNRKLSELYVVAYYRFDSRKLNDFNCIYL